VFASSVNIAGVDVKITVFIWIALVAVATWVLMRTRVGNWIFAVGGDANAARAVGVPVKATKIGLFMGVGFCGWILGMHNLFAFDTVQSGEGVGNEFLYYRAVIGGCLLTGGYGSAIGGAIGAFIFGMANKGIVCAQWNGLVQVLPGPDAAAGHHRQPHRQAPRGTQVKGLREMNTNEIDQQTLLQNEKDPLTHTPVHLLSLEGVGKHYGNIIALSDVTMAVDNGRVTCVLGDNGAANPR
jgi:hypothetical protein